MKYFLALSFSLFFLTTAIPVGAEDALSWAGLIAYKKGQKELHKLPEIKVLRIEDKKVFIEVKNNTGIDLNYSGYGKNSTQFFMKNKKNGEWVPTSWARCKTGISEYQLKNGESLSLSFFLPEKSQQYFTMFRNSKDSNEFSLVLLYQYEKHPMFNTPEPKDHPWIYSEKTRPSF